MARFGMTFYWSATVTIALSCTIFELFDVEQYRDLEIWLMITQYACKILTKNSQPLGNKMSK